jgi:hypothetical protein
MTGSDDAVDKISMKLVAWPTEILRGDYGDDREGDRYYCDISYTLIRLADGINQKSQDSVRCLSLRFVLVHHAFNLDPVHICLAGAKGWVVWAWGDQYQYLTMKSTGTRL